MSKKEEKSRAGGARGDQYGEHMLSIKDLASKFKTSLNADDAEKCTGLSMAVAAKRLEEQGLNQLTPPKQMTTFERLLRILFVDPFMVMLEVACGLGFVAYGLTPDDHSNLYLSCALVIIIGLTAALTLFQEGQASDVMAGFQNMLPTQTLVLRSGKRERIAAKNLVTGDVVVLETGDKIPADLRILSVNSLKVDNSSLTGESMPIKATVQAASEEFLEAHNLVFSGTLCVEGTGVGVVIRTGDNSMVGSIAALASGTAKEKSTLEIEIIRFIKIIGVVAFIMACTFFVVSLVRFGTSTKDIVNSFVTAFIVVLLSNLPQGLPSAVALCLTIAAKKLAARNVYVKSLNSIETLGSVSVIASDKTGTLTQNCMTVTSVWINKRSYLVQKLATLEHDGDAENPLDDTLATLTLVSGVCNMASPISSSDTIVVRTESQFMADELRQPNNRQSSVYMAGRPAIDHTMRRTSCVDAPLPKLTAKNLTGNASDVALYVFAENFGTGSVQQTRDSWRQVFQVPFSSARKWMLCVLAPPKSHTDQRRLLCVKGAPERVMSRCCSLYVNGKCEPITDEITAAFKSANDKYMKQGRRVLALSVRRLPENEYPCNLTSGVEKDRFQAKFDENILVPDPAKMTLETGLSMVGCTALEDPPKDTVPGAVLKCRKAGIRVVMVTGDHPATAAAIARQCNILGMYNTKEDVERKRSVILGTTVTVPDDDEDIGGIVVTGKELQAFSEADWERVLSKPEIVFARTSPHDKLNIVEHLQARGEVVAVTGDGVNDSPALKKADVGVAMGIAGSDVAKDAGDIVLVDDEFNSLVLGIEQGRIIFDNLTKLVTFTLTHLMPEIAAILLPLALGMPQGMSSLCILSVDLLIDVAPSLALAYEPAEDSVMVRPPRDIKTDRLVTPRVMVYAYFQAGLLELIPGLFAYFGVFYKHDIMPSDLINSGKFFVEDALPLTIKGIPLSAATQLNILANAQTAFWATLVLSQFFHMWMCKTRVSSVFSAGIFNNRSINLAGGMMLAFFVSITYIPFLQPIFGTASDESLFIFLPSLFSFVTLWSWNEFRKWVFRNYPSSLFTRIFAW